jgi:hypothetical protein
MVNCHFTRTRKNGNALGLPSPMRRALSVFLVLGSLVLTSGQESRADSPSEVPPTASDASKPERPYHPEPRVVVNVVSLKGPHNQARVQHDARFGWKRIVRCYKAHSPHKPAVVTMALIISAEGSVERVQDTGSVPANRELERCLADVLPGLSMPKANDKSTANVEIKLAPGDRPN